MQCIQSFANIKQPSIREEVLSNILLVSKSEKSHSNQTTGYRIQMSGQVKRYKKSIVTDLQEYFAKQLNNRDIFFQSLTNACNARAYRSIELLSFSLVLTYHLPAPAPFDISSHQSGSVCVLSTSTKKLGIGAVNTNSSRPTSYKNLISNWDGSYRIIWV